MGGEFIHAPLDGVTRIGISNGREGKTSTSIGKFAAPASIKTTRYEKSTRVSSLKNSIERFALHSTVYFEGQSIIKLESLIMHQSPSSLAEVEFPCFVALSALLEYLPWPILIHW